MLNKWLVKYKLYHIPFWCIYFALFLSPLEVKYAFYIPIQLAAVYFNLYFLIPAYLEKGKIRSYILLLIGLMALTSGGIVAGYHITAFLAHRSVYQLYGPDHCIYYFFGNAVPAVFACLILTLSIRLTKVRILTQRRQQLLEKEQLETELNFLKHQFNPHFLFNTINSIFFLIHKRPDTASESLARFSDLLRYQLYECNDKQIPLVKEISHLKNTIELERLRQNEHVRVSLHLDDLQSAATASPPLGIAPFILMTFVENSFKHVSGDPASITIRLHLEQQQLNFCIANSIAAHNPTAHNLTAHNPTDPATAISTTTHNPGTTTHNPGTTTHNSGTATHNKGIGLKNVRRRLDLLYPGRHHLNIISDSHTFEVRLLLDLSPIPAPPPLRDPSPAATPGLSFLA